MKLYEHQGKELFRRFAVPTPRGVLARTPDQVIAAVKEIGLPVVLKVQIQSGGRGKAGGIRIVASEAEALGAAQDLLGAEIREELVTKLLVEEKVSITKEIYASIAVDRLAGKPLLLLSAQGGVDIEELAEKAPDQIVRFYIEPNTGLRYYQAVESAKLIGLTGKLMTGVAEVLLNLYRLFQTCDAEVAEINPLVITESGEVIASDAKVVINDDALARQKQVIELIDDPEVLTAVLGEARSKGYSYVELDGNVGLIGGGAGLTLMLMDLISMSGGKAANFADIMGGIKRENIKELVDIILDRVEVDRKIGSVVVVCSLTATPVESFVGGIADAIKGRKATVPLIAVIHAVDGAVKSMSLNEALDLLQSVGVQTYDSINEAVAAAVAALKGRN